MVVCQDKLVGRVAAVVDPDVDNDHVRPVDRPPGSLVNLGKKLAGHGNPTGSRAQNPAGGIGNPYAVDSQLVASNTDIVALGPVISRSMVPGYPAAGRY